MCTCVVRPGTSECGYATVEAVLRVEGLVKIKIKFSLKKCILSVSFIRKYYVFTFLYV
jgi:hypothetical protein